MLILAPVGRDAELACAVMEREHLTATICSSVGRFVLMQPLGNITLLEIRISA